MFKTSKVYDEGWKAFESGKLSHSNPYSVGTILYKRWLAGYEDVKEFWSNLNG